MNKKIIIYSFIGLFIVFFFLTPEKKKDKVLKIKTNEEVQAELEEAKKIKKVYDEQRVKRGLSSIQYKEAQRLYLKGFRDFRNQLYSKATDNFNACLSLFAAHSLCKRYLTLSEKKHDEKIQNYVLLAKQYKEQSQYKKCKKTYENIKVMVDDPESLIYKDAEINEKICETFSKGVY